MSLSQIDILLVQRSDAHVPYLLLFKGSSSFDILPDSSSPSFMHMLFISRPSRTCLQQTAHHDRSPVGVRTRHD